MLGRGNTACKLQIPRFHILLLAPEECQVSAGVVPSRECRRKRALDASYHNHESYVLFG